jgi:hypothetical protein
MANTGEDKGSGKKGRLEEHPLVAALVPDPGAGPANAAVLHGYIGKSTKSNVWRLYLDAALTSYAELSQDDILHHRQIDNDGGTLVWVPKSLELKVTKVSSATIQAEFLSGAIAAGRMTPTQQTKSASPAFANVPSVGCPSILNNCSTAILPCPSDGCVTWGICPTETGWCRPSEFRPLCTIFEL